MLLVFTCVHRSSCYFFLSYVFIIFLQTFYIPLFTVSNQRWNNLFVIPLVSISLTGSYYFSNPFSKSLFIVLSRRSIRVHIAFLSNLSHACFQPIVFASIYYICFNSTFPFTLALLIPATIQASFIYHRRPISYWRNRTIYEQIHNVIIQMHKNVGTKLIVGNVKKFLSEFMNQSFHHVSCNQIFSILMSKIPPSYLLSPLSFRPILPSRLFYLHHIETHPLIPTILP